jgi:hypothetical protein
MFLTNQYQSYTIFSEKEKLPGSSAYKAPESWHDEDIKMTWQACALLFLGIVVVCFLIAFIEVWWKSRKSYYIGSAKPRRNNHK